MTPTPNQRIQTALRNFIERDSREPYDEMPDTFESFCARCGEDLAACDCERQDS